MGPEKDDNPSPKINRRYMNGGGKNMTGYFGAETYANNYMTELPTAGKGIRPYRLKENNEPPYIFEDTVVLHRDNNNQLTMAEPVKQARKQKQKTAPSYM